MKRHPALQTLSRDHHQALVIARRLRRTENRDAENARAAFLNFWRTEGAAHFRAEEEVMLPRFAAAGGAGSAAVARVLLDHAEIRLRALRLQGGTASIAELVELGELLSEHVHLEERDLFPAIEEVLEDRELRKLAADLAAAEGH
jgi:hemerythrin-like domain-containing protein